MTRERKGRVEGKMAFVTGGAQGLGKASAFMLAREGAKVTLADINEKGAAEVAAEINEECPGMAFAVGVDDDPLRRVGRKGQCGELVRWQK